MSEHVSADAVVLGVDLGGTQIRAAAILSTGERLGRRSVATPLAGGPEAIYAGCTDLLRGVIADLPGGVRDRLVAIGISSMGPVDPWRGLIVDPPNVVALRDAPLADEVEARLGLPTYLEKDTNVAALAEHWLGAARGCNDFLYITVSTGLGGAIWRDGHLMLGPDGTAGEIGHICLIPDGGPRCGCGGSGHLEAIASGSGLATAAQDVLAAVARGQLATAIWGEPGAGDRVEPATCRTGDGGPTSAAPGGSSFLAARAADGALTGRDVAEGELAGDDVCTRLMERARRAFAISCVGWVNAFNPERIVVGGTVAERQGERWLEPARAAVSATGLRCPAERVRIVPAELGHDVGLAGAWPLVDERHGVPAWRERRVKA
jgi:glucokinase